MYILHKDRRNKEMMKKRVRAIEIGTASSNTKNKNKIAAIE